MRRLACEEGGFTLPEMMVTMVVMIVVLFALYSIFDMSLRVFSFGNDKVEAVENARLGLEKLERELRAAYPYDKPAGKDHLFWSPGYPATEAIPPPDQISFGNDLNGNGRIAGDEATESISYYLDGRVLKRSINGGAGAPVAESLQAGGFEIHRYGSVTGAGCPKRDGAGNLIPEATTEASIQVLCLKLTVSVDGRSQTLITDVALRNRG
jgi:prepilin-type N-terminal cleavage/methylation domain-containing protein